MNIMTNFTRIFMQYEDKLEYCYAFGIWRLMWNGSNQRAILRGWWPNARILADWPEGCELIIMGGKVQDPSIPTAGERVMTLKNCRSRRRWMPEPSAIAPDATAALTMWLEIDCEVDLA